MIFWMIQIVIAVLKWKVLKISLNTPKYFLSSTQRDVLASVGGRPYVLLFRFCAGHCGNAHHVRWWWSILLLLRFKLNSSFANCFLLKPELLLLRNKWLFFKSSRGLLGLLREKIILIHLINWAIIHSRCSKLQRRLLASSSQPDQQEADLFILKFLHFGFVAMITNFKCDCTQSVTKNTSRSSKAEQQRSNFPFYLTRSYWDERQWTKMFSCPTPDVVVLFWASLLELIRHFRSILDSLLFLEAGPELL